MGNVFRKLCFLVVILALYFGVHSRVCASTSVENDIEINTTWTKAGNPYVLTQPITVAEGATLSVEPGVVIEVDTAGMLVVYGALDFEGSVLEPIVMRSHIVGNAWYGVLFDTAVPSTLNHVESHDSSQGLMLFDSAITSTDFVSDKGVSIFNGHGAFTNLVATGMHLYSTSTVSVTNISLASSDPWAITLYGASALSIDGGTIEGSSDQYSDAIGIFDGSHGEFKNVSIDTKNSTSDAIGVYGPSNSLVLDESSIVDAHTAVELYSGAQVHVTGSSITCTSDCIVVDGSTFSIDHSHIFGAQGTAFAGFNALITASFNSIESNESHVVATGDEASIDMRSNWWGSKDGPPEGSIPSAILFNPWLHYDPIHPGSSSVLFIPGIEASRLYKKKTVLGVDVEDQLWEPNGNADIEDLSMLSSGESIDDSIYTKDIIDEVNVPVSGSVGSNIYKSFMASMDSLVSHGTIDAWKPIAYDWRFSPSDIVARGVEHSDGSISYTHSLESNEVPYIITQLQKLADASKDGKVTIVTHSNGGLVAKALIKKLMHMKEYGGNTLVDSIDRLIMVAPPQLGTPDAVAALLHGYNEGHAGGVIARQTVMRNIGINLPGLYSLLPSAKYFEMVSDSVIILDKSIDEISSMRLHYGDRITTFEAFRRFILDVFGSRYPQTGNNLDVPIVGNARLFDGATDVHNGIDDLEIPETIHVYQVAGWGLPTIKDIEYVGKHYCKNNASLVCTFDTVLRPIIHPTVDGDGTVVTASAVSPHGENYYLNLKKYNEEGVFNREHKNIFEVPSLQFLIKNILTGVTTLPNYISTIKPQNSDNLVLRMKSPVSLGVYDSAGRYTGLVHDSDSDSDHIEEQIPNSAYFQIGEEKTIVVPYGSVYTVDMHGLAQGIFTFEKERMVNDVSVGMTSFVDIPTSTSMHARVHIDPSVADQPLSIDTDGNGSFETQQNPGIWQASRKSHSRGSHGYIPLKPMVIEKPIEVPKVVLKKASVKIIKIKKKLKSKKTKLKSVLLKSHLRYNR